MLYFEYFVLWAKEDWETIWVRFFLLKATLFKLLKYVDSSYN